MTVCAGTPRRTRTYNRGLRGSTNGLYRVLGVLSLSNAANPPCFARVAAGPGGPPADRGSVPKLGSAYVRLVQWESTALVNIRAPMEQPRLVMCPVVSRRHPGLEDDRGHRGPLPPESHPGGPLTSISSLGAKPTVIASGGDAVPRRARPCRRQEPAGDDTGLSDRRSSPDTASCVRPRLAVADRPG